MPPQQYKTKQNLPLKSNESLISKILIATFFFVALETVEFSLLNIKHSFRYLSDINEDLLFFFQVKHPNSLRRNTFQHDILSDIIKTSVRDFYEWSQLWTKLLWIKDLLSTRPLCFIKQVYLGHSCWHSVSGGPWETG